MTAIQAILVGLAGLGAGMIAGLVGVGGGVVFTPVLFAVYGLLDVPSGVRTPLTVGTGLFCTGMAAGASAFHHLRREAVVLRTALGVGLTSVVAVGLVSRFVVTQPWYEAALFQLLFSGVLLVVAVRVVRGARRGSATSDEKSGAGWRAWLGTGTAAGTVAAAVGVGGGVVLVPAYSRLFKLSFPRAVGTSSATILVISGLSVGAYILLGSGIGGRPPFAVGYVDVGTGLLLSGPAILGARAGATLAHRVRAAWLRWGFAALALVVAGRLSWGAIAGVVG